MRPNFGATFSTCLSFETSTGSLFSRAAAISIPSPSGMFSSLAMSSPLTDGDTASIMSKATDVFSRIALHGLTLQAQYNTLYASRSVVWVT